MTKKYFKIAGMTVCIEADLDLEAIKFNPALEKFEVPGPGEDNLYFRHHFYLPDLTEIDLGKRIHYHVPWAIYQNKETNRFYYQCISPERLGDAYHLIADFSSDHTEGIIYHRPMVLETVKKYYWESVLLLSTDQVWLPNPLADRQAFIIHSSGMILNDHGMAFVGHSEAGKSTIIQLLTKAHQDRQAQVEILCDDRNILRKTDQWFIHGTWSHGDIPEVSPNHAPLNAVFFLQQSKFDRLEPITDRNDILHRLLSTLIVAARTPEWFQKTLSIIETFISENNFYVMHFTTSGDIVPQLVELTGLPTK